MNGIPDHDVSRQSRPGLPAAWRVGLALISGVALGLLVSVGCVAARSDLNLPLLEQAWGIIKLRYVDQAAVKPAPLTHGAIEGMVAALGDTGHSTFLTAAMVQNLKSVERGELKGIGVEIQMKAGQVVVVAPLDNSPAQRAGLSAGDVILKVSDQDISDWPVSRVVERITGPAGTSVALTILNPRTGSTRRVTITRATLRLQNVTWQRLPATDLVHLRIASFGKGAAKSLRAALVEIQREPKTGVILDLRNNPGGLLDEAVLAASQFLEDGNVLLVKGATGRIRPVPVEKGGVGTKVSLAILINIGTASAAEIVAGALQDGGRAALVGETTFGTGTVLEQFTLADGSALLLAIEEWLTPNGHSFWHKGISPQVQVSLPDDAMPLTPETERNITADQLKSSQDRQLLRAVELLTQPPSADKARASLIRPLAMHNCLPD